MDEQQKKTLAALYAHWMRRAEISGPTQAERGAHWLDCCYGMEVTLDTLGFKVVQTPEFPCWAIEQKP